MTLRIIGWLFGGASAAAVAAVIYAMLAPEQQSPVSQDDSGDSSVSVVIEQNRLTADDGATSESSNKTGTSDSTVQADQGGANTPADLSAQASAAGSQEDSLGRANVEPESREPSGVNLQIGSAPQAETDTETTAPLVAQPEVSQAPSTGSVGALAVLPPAGNTSPSLGAAPHSSDSSGISTGASGVGTEAREALPTIDQPAELDEEIAAVPLSESEAATTPDVSRSSNDPQVGTLDDGAALTADQDPNRTQGAPAGPSFDVVRVDSDGQTVIAGTAEPEERVEVLLNGEVVGEAVADASGQFVAIVFATLSRDAQKLELRTQIEDPAVTDQDGEQQGEMSIDGPAAPPKIATAGSSDEPTNDETRTADEPTGSALSDDAPEVSTGIGGLTLPSTGTDWAVGANGTTTDGAGTGPSINAVSSLSTQEEMNSSEPPAASGSGQGPSQQYAISAPVIILPSNAPDAAPTLVQPKRDSLALLQPEARDIAGVVLDSITYDDAGAVVLSGRGLPGRTVRIYANGRQVGDIRVGADGRWAWTSATGDAQAIKLFRMDEIGSAGEVTSRIETPFEYSRLSPQVVRDRQVVIQRGDMLWRIAEQFYGDGIRYSTIYGANAKLIRDPDLIYPGQVFTIPELVDAD
ncbi:MAG: LysM peptidoglycan-binding domain-containing protein [Pseudomonadota bacterium]